MKPLSPHTSEVRTHLYLAAAEIGQLIGAYAPGADAGKHIDHVAVHSTHLRGSSLFFAVGEIDGQGVERGHEYVRAALERGASVVVSQAWYSANEPTIPPGSAVFVVGNTLKALHTLAKWWRKQFEGKVVAVTGSIGKTITKDALAEFLRAEFSVEASPGSENSCVDVPLALLNASRKAQFTVIEAAYAQPRDLKILGRIIDPHVQVVTAATDRNDHLFGGGHSVVAELASCRTPKTDLVFAGNDALAEALRHEYAPKVAVESTAAGRGSATITARGTTSTVCEYVADGIVYPATIATGSRHVAEDVLIAAAVATRLGVDPEQVATVLQDFAPTRSRVEIWRTPEGFRVVRDVMKADSNALAAGVQVAQDLANGVSPETGEKTSGSPQRCVLLVASDAGDLSDQMLDRLGRMLAETQFDDVCFVGSKSASERLGDYLDKTTSTRIQAVRTFDDTAISEWMRSHLVSGDVVLALTNDDVGIEQLAARYISAVAPTRLYLDVSALEQNVRSFEALIGPKSKLTAMVKALAYGTDAVPLSQALQRMGIPRLAVASVDEGIVLRRAGINNVEILVTLASPDEIDKARRYQLTPSIYSLDLLRVCARHELSVHVEVETGMHRTGLSTAELESAFEIITESTTLSLAGLSTHFASADDPAEDAFTRSQIDRIDAAAERARAWGLKDFEIHMAATAGAMRFPESHRDSVRIGLGLYGVHPSDATRECMDLRPVLALVSRIVEINDAEPGDRVGYNGTYPVDRPTRIAVVPAGYHDCIPRDMSNKGRVKIHDVECRMIGRISMDSTLIDVTDCPTATVGSDVLIYGNWQGMSMSIEAAATNIDTIPYELMTRIGPRVQRIISRH